MMFKNLSCIAILNNKGSNYTVLLAELTNEKKADCYKTNKFIITYKNG